MEKYPKISIVTVSYNQADYLEDNIKSVIEQNYPSVEHIIIDAGSSDETLAILKKYNHLYWTSEPDTGQSSGLNKGFKKATGKIIGWVNSDDRIPKDALHKVAKYFIKNPKEIAVVGDQSFIDEYSNIIKIIKSQEYSYNYLLNIAKGITQNSIFFKQKVFNKVGFIDESLKYAMDRDFFIRVSKIKNIQYIQEILGEFRLHSNSKTSEGTYKFSIEHMKIRKKYGGKFLSPCHRNDIYMIVTQPLRRIRLLRKLVQRLRSFTQ